MARVGVRNDYIVVGLDSFTTDDFVHYVRRHLETVKKTKQIEEYGKSLIANQFAPDELKWFIEYVCTWGGRALIGDRVLESDRIEIIRELFMEAYDLLERQPPQIDMAVEEISKIRGLSISFGSKHLRFLRPDICAVLDSIVSENLGYNLNRFGYEGYSIDCQSLAKYLEDNGVENPVDRGGPWFAADIDLGVFAFIQGW